VVGGGVGERAFGRAVGGFVGGADLDHGPRQDAAGPDHRAHVDHAGTE
jgi:hypothetical protein